jgi:flagellar protein FliO/FliZ
MFLTAGMSTFENILQLLGLFLLFIFILGATYFATRLIGKIQLNQNNNSNFKNIETYKVSPNKYLQLVQIGSRYFVIAIGKNDISVITELDKEEIKQGNKQKLEKSDFAKSLFHAMNKNKKNENEG